MARNPVVLVHGYSDKGKSFATWRDILKQNGYQTEEISVCSYESLTNEVTIKDVAEGFDRALRVHANLKPDQSFDAIVHSTGMLVVRAWLTSYNKRRERLGRLIGIAPASFGSPLAHQGRSVLGAIFKGSKHAGPDFLEAGDRILDGLELASRFTWDLAHLDLLPYDPHYNPYPEKKDPEHTFYGKDSSTPYVFIFCGTEPYGGLRKLVNQPGTDGTVRWAGCSLRTRKITIDLTRDRENADGEGQPVGKHRFNVLRGTNIPIPVVPAKGLTHGSIIKAPTKDLAGMVLDALTVSSEAEFLDWHARRGATAENSFSYVDKWGREGGLWAQFVVHAVDERNDPITDYHLEFFADGGANPLEIDIDVYPYSGDKSFRCYHVDLNQINGGQISDDILRRLHVRVMANSGSQLVTYHGLGSEKSGDGEGDGKWDAVLDLADLPPETTSQAEHLFRPFSTTLIELVMNREPLPLDAATENKVCYWEEFDD